MRLRISVAFPLVCFLHAGSADVEMVFKRRPAFRMDHLDDFQAHL